MHRESIGKMRRVALALAAASLWSMSLVVASLVAPIYSHGGATTDSGSTTSVAPGGATLVGVNGARVLIIVAMPAVATVLVWLALRWKSSGASRHAGRAAWAVVSLLAALCLVGAFSIGVFMAPVAVLLGYATNRTPGDSALHLCA